VGLRSLAGEPPLEELDEEGGHFYQFGQREAWFSVGVPVFQFQAQ